MCGAFSGFCPLPSPPLCFPLCISVTGACLIRGVGLMGGCQVLPAISEVSILELVANSGSSRMSRAPNLHRLSWSDEVVYMTPSPQSMVFKLFSFAHMMCLISHFHYILLP